MFTQFSTSLPINIHADKPWHPENLTDLGEVDLKSLPLATSDLCATPGYLWHLGTSLVGHPDDVRDRMIGAFLHWPNICFARATDGSVWLFEKIETEVKE